MNMDITIFFNRYQRKNLPPIGKSAWGNSYRGIDLVNKHEIIIKVYHSTGREGTFFAKPKEKHPEAAIYEDLRSKKVDCIPHVYDLGLDQKASLLVMEWLGPSLHELLEFSVDRLDKPFSPVTVARLGHRLIGYIEEIHSAGYLHCDVSTANLRMKTNGHATELKLMDFVQARKIDKADDQTSDTCKPISHTDPYSASFHRHQWKTQSRRDDLEALVYVLAHCALGNDLPWIQYRKTKHNKHGFQMDERYNQIKVSKAHFHESQAFQNMPKELRSFFHHTQQLRHKDIPDYQAMRRIFEDALQSYGAGEDLPYEWDSLFGAKSLPKKTVLCSSDEHHKSMTLWKSAGPKWDSWKETRDGGWN